MSSQLFSSLYGILPSSKKYLKQGDFSDAAAAWILLGCFTGGFLSIQAVSRFLHRYIPSYSVPCDHNHDNPDHDSLHNLSRAQSYHSQSHRHPDSVENIDRGAEFDENTALLKGTNGNSGIPRSKTGHGHSHTPEEATHDLSASRRKSLATDRRPSMLQVQRRVMSFVKDSKSDCDESGPCFGYSEPCGKECFKYIGQKSPRLSHAALFSRSVGHLPHRRTSLVSSVPEDEPSATDIDSTRAIASAGESRGTSRDADNHACESDDEDLEAQHHHHVPENQFLSISLQLCFSITVHKLPEGFITFATNHANSNLGFSVFMALLIHNIGEGFSLSLPLYLALGSRGRAMFWSSLLGGLSQPLGAACAYIWLKVSQKTDHTPGFAVYGCMFAITAGLMTSVALTLFAEALSLHHNRNLCIGFALIGMAILGTSNALTAA